MGLVRALFSLIFLVAILGAGAAAGGWLWLTNEIQKDGPLTADTVVTVSPGEGLYTVASRLESDGVISNGYAMRLAGRLQGLTTEIKTGEFEIAAGSSVQTVLDTLVDGKVILHRLTIPEGRTTAQALRLIEASEFLRGDMPTETIPEGALLPDTYLFARGTTRTAIVEKMRRAQDTLLDELWPERQDGLPIKTREEAIILASIVEKETGDPAERPEIAGLFTNRLNRGMPLQSDPTIIYGITKGEPLYNSKGERRTLYRSEIDRKTDWNTYQIPALPITPICNPGRDAIAAVLNPPETEYIFFVADGTGRHLFAKTLAEHNRNVAAYRRYERAEIARERNSP
ncbi:MAG: endolytic transglycosylase MltG [Pseudomonadota bacterium]